MYVWVLAGVVLGLVLSRLAGKIARSPSLELIYITIAGALRRRQTDPLQRQDQQPTPQARWKAAAGRLNLF
jgi:hypothetical protein